MLLILYHIVMSLVIIVLCPFLLLAPGRNAREKLGLHLKKENSFQDTVWVHALSVGEVISAIPLLKAIKGRYPERALVLTVTTNQGMAIAHERLSSTVEAVISMPMDFWWSMHRAVHCINPSIFVLVETDIWPGLLSLLRKKSVKCLLVNGRVSPRTFTSYRRLSFLVKRLFGFFDRCLMQTDLDRDRLSTVGIEKEKILTAGNIKFDHEWTPMTDNERAEWMERLGIKAGHRVLVAGSTHPGEEEMFLRVLKRLRQEFRTLRLLLAPRRIERAKEVLAIARKIGVSAVLRSRMEHHAPCVDITIVDTLGELIRLYGLAEISFVGGSMVPFGGHNLLEPASFGCPVLFGPHTENFAEMAEEIVRVNGGWRVHDEEELEKAILRLLNDSEMCRDMGKRAREFVIGNKGAVERVLDEMGQFLVQGGEVDWA